MVQAQPDEDLAAGVQMSLALSSESEPEPGLPSISYEQPKPPRTMTLPPLFYYHHDPDTDSSEFDLLYPVFTYDRFGSEYRWQLLQIISDSGGGNQQTNIQKRLSFFPIYFQQRSTDPALNYTALVPFYGNLQNHFFRDEIHFVMFPLYLETRKRDVTTDNYLFPFFHRRHGEGLQGWQFWPLAGQERKTVSTKTNSFDEVEIVGGHEKSFVLWPFYFNNKLGLGTDNPQTQQLLLPFYSLQRSPQRDSSSYLWPVGLTYTVDREKKYHEWGAPWPLVVFARGEGKTANRIWPFFGQARTPILESDFYLWPLYKYNRAQAAPLDRQRTRILFFLYSDLSEKNTAAGTALERTDLWPLFTARRDHQGNERLQILALLEPILPNNKSIERNCSPVWSLWRSEKNPRVGTAKQTVLWNLYGREVTASAKKYSLLFGLIQYQSGPAGQRWRRVFVPLHKERQPPAAKSRPESAGRE